MLKSIGVLVALIAAVTIGSSAAEAVKYCAPLPVGGGFPTCKCAIQNYSTVTDAGITVTVYPGNGTAQICGPLSLPPKQGTYCHAAISPNSTCGCVVSGESSLTYASLSVMESPTSGVLRSSVPCQ